MTGKMEDAAAGELEEAVELGADPERAVAIFAEGGYADEFVGLVFVGLDVGEFKTVKTDEAGAGADPEKTIAGLEDGGDGFRRRGGGYHDCFGSTGHP